MAVLYMSVVLAGARWAGAVLTSQTWRCWVIAVLIVGVRWFGMSDARTISAGFSEAACPEWVPAASSGWRVRACFGGAGRAGKENREGAAREGEEGRGVSWLGGGVEGSSGTRSQT